MKIVCQTNDPVFAQLIKVAENFPGAMKAAEAATLDDSEHFANLSSDAFAMPETRQFPVSDRDQTIISIGYAKLASAPLPPSVVDALEKAAAVYDINVDELFPTPTEIPSAEKIVYLLPEIRRFKVASADDVISVERAFVDKYSQMSVEQRVEAGTNLVAQATEYGVELQSSTQKLAGFTITSTRIMRDWAEARKNAAETLGSTIASAYTKIAQDMSNLPAYIYNRKDQLKLVEMFVDMDKTAGIDEVHGSLIPDPFRTVFNTDMIPKDYVKVGSALANKQLLAQLPLEFWKDILGDSGALEIAPNGEIDPELLSQVVTTLPADLKNTVETQLAAYNK